MNDENTQKPNDLTGNVTDDAVNLGRDDDAREDFILDTEDVDDSIVSEESQKETIKKLREKIKTLEKEKGDYLTSWQKD